MHKVTWIFILLLNITIKIFAQHAADTSGIIQFVFTSDAHYGITRSNFRGTVNADAHAVNTAMLEKINSISAVMLPQDSGVNGGHVAGAVDFLVEGGDIANRMEIPIQSATVSWGQFETDYLKGSKLIDHSGDAAKFFIIPGNHDISNAIGFYRAMSSAMDPASMVNIYNLMMSPSMPKTKDTYHYPLDKINYSKNIVGIHFMFINLWPDSLERVWMEQDLQNISSYMPVIIFAHDQPESEAKHFSNPNPPHDINATDKFENLLAEYYKDELKIGPDKQITTIEQKGWVGFLKQHHNIKAYFHGNSNCNEFYVYSGPDNDVALNTFRVDSPMKGKFSSKDEKKLSFQLVTINCKSGEMTARECLWNTDPDHPEKSIIWGLSKTVFLK
jgi:hypothetical protein